MKKVFLIKKTWLIICLLFIGNVHLQAQTPQGNATFVNPVGFGPGNTSCHAGLIQEQGLFSFPIPTGLTLAQLNHVSTDYWDISSGPYTIDILATVQCSNGQVVIFLGDFCCNGGWGNTGNLATGPDYISAQAIHGSCLVISIKIRTYSSGASTLLDNTIINNRTYNYDDCDGDGLLDIYDCDPGNAGNNKVLVCHNNNTICVAQAALQAHLNHGDYMGSCQSSFAPNISSTEVIKKDEVKLYPSPATSQVTVQNESGKLLGNVRIYDITGKIVYQEFVGQSKKTISITNLAAGIYYLRSDQLQATIKFVKQ